MIPCETKKEGKRKQQDSESDKDSEDEWKFVDFFESSQVWVHQMRKKHGQNWQEYKIKLENDQEKGKNIYGKSLLDCYKEAKLTRKFPDFKKLKLSSATSQSR